jgi:hypothetical protein
MLGALMDEAAAQLAEREAREAAAVESFRRRLVYVVRRITNEVY